MAENNTDYVERAPLLAKLKELQPSVFCGPLMVRALEEAPAADVAPVVRGEWVPVERLVPDWGANIIHHYECSNCKILEYTNDRKYCSNCGAKMTTKGEVI